MAIFVLSTAVVGAVRLTTLTAGAMMAVPVLALFAMLDTTAGLDTLAAFAVTLLLATVAATAVLACAACAFTATWATAAFVAATVVVLLVPVDAGVLGACADNSSSLVLVVAVFVVLALVVPLPLLELLEPLALSEPDTTIAPPVTLIEPVEPPLVETAPLTVTA